MGYHPGRTVIRLDLDVRRSHIQVAALVHEFGKPLPRIGALEKGTARVGTGARREAFQWRIEVDHDAPLGEPAAVGFPQNDAAAGGDNDAPPLGEFLDDRFLAVTKFLLALDIEDPWNVRPGAFLDHAVAVDEVELQGLGEVPADCGLAGRHHPDEKDVAVGHGRNLRVWRIV